MLGPSGTSVVILPFVTPVAEPSQRTAELDLSFLSELRDASRASGMDLVGESLRAFLDVTVPRLRDLSAALASGDGYAAGLVAHTLRGGCAQFGALRMARLAGFIELQVRDGITPPVHDAAAALHEEFASVRAQLLREFVT